MVEGCNGTQVKKGDLLWRACESKQPKSSFLANFANCANQKINKLLRINTQRHNESLFLRPYEATVENGQIKLPEKVHLPDQTKVFVVVPETESEPFTIDTGDDGLPIIRMDNGIIISQLVEEIEAQTA